MTYKVIHIPPMNDNPHDFAQLFMICKEAGEQSEEPEVKPIHCTTTNAITMAIWRRRPKS